MTGEAGDLIEWPRVWELRDEIGDEEFGEVVTLFLEETETMVDALMGAPPDGLEGELHALKGAALNLGFAQLAKLCATGEQMAKQGRAEEVAISPVLSCFMESRDRFTDQVGQTQ
ncbi:MAG: Hpt domain-containing protein [Pseudomonadota bacterium]